jgi:hypothetical protein
MCLRGLYLIVTYQDDRMTMSKIVCKPAHELTHSFQFEILYWLNDGVKTRSARLFVSGATVPQWARPPHSRGF